MCTCRVFHIDYVGVRSPVVTPTNDDNDRNDSEVTTNKADDSVHVESPGYVGVRSPVVTPTNDDNDSDDIEAEIENTTIFNDINADLLLSNMNATVVLDTDMEERKGPQKLITQDFLADKVIKENRITFVSSMGCFVVEGFTSKKYLVNLTPESCSCPSLKTCYHLKAVKKAFNITTGNNAKTPSKNISQLRKNSRPRQGKTTGQKNLNLQILKLHVYLKLLP